MILHRNFLSYWLKNFNKWLLSRFLSFFEYPFTSLCGYNLFNHFFMYFFLFSSCFFFFWPLDVFDVPSAPLDLAFGGRIPDEVESIEAWYWISNWCVGLVNLSIESKILATEGNIVTSSTRTFGTNIDGNSVVSTLFGNNIFSWIYTSLRINLQYLALETPDATLEWEKELPNYSHSNDA